jgi:hypothetical protein
VERTGLNSSDVQAKLFEPGDERIPAAIAGKQFSKILVVDSHRAAEATN